MKLQELALNPAHWLSGANDEDGIVLSCRMRLARNLASVSFSQTITEEEQDGVIEKALMAAQHSTRLRNAVFFKMNALPNNERRLLVERHLVSPALADSKGPRGVLFNRDEMLSVMINEEDHLRLQAILPGLKAEEAWDRMNKLDDELGAGIDYAYEDKWGYLTACPTNTGTGLRASVLIHLPALVLTEDMERVMRGLTHLSFAVRGFYGEGTNAAGNLFQISNQTTLGRSESEIVNELSRVTQELIRCERTAQETLLNEARSQLEDKVWRAYGLLANARVLGSQEFMNLLSALRLGRTLSIIDEVSTGFMNHLMIETQPSHMQTHAGQVLKPEERDIRRAGMVRKRILEGRNRGEASSP